MVKAWTEVVLGNAPPLLMKCGHTANAINSGSRKPCCAICIGIDPGAEVVAEIQPTLEGRVARCAFCGLEAKSGLTLAFFEYHPDRPYDMYYCGCRGWD